MHTASTTTVTTQTAAATPENSSDAHAFLRPPDNSGRNSRSSRTSRASRNSRSKTSLAMLLTSDEDASDDEHIALTPTNFSRSNTDASNTSSNDNSFLSRSSSTFTDPPFLQKTTKQIIKELCVEVMPALLVSVAGSICAGYILGSIQNNRAFDRIPAFFIMVPVLLNLKSNTELNMSTRMSTLANLGFFDSPKESLKAIRSNMLLLLLQSTAVGASVGLISTLLSLLPSSGSNTTPFFRQASLLMASAIGCAVIGSFLVGLLISFTIYVSRMYGVDPDNIGTPIASSFGDMSTLLILGFLTTFLIATQPPFPLLISLAFVALALLILHNVRNDEHTTQHLSKGWLPLVYAAATSSIAGLVVEKFADSYPAMPALVPVLNGIGGNIGTVFASRLSTSLHKRQAASSEHNLVLFILLIINIPIQIGFLALHRIFDPSLVVNVWFVFVYISATVIHGLAILSLAKFACKLLWSRGYDPDDCVNPFITGSGD
ncbi:hypothetical protein GGI05_003148, partial [Coemansia sp. RSA 2603]